MSRAPDPASGPAEPGTPAGGEPPVRVNPPGRWVTTPQGERIFLLDPPRPTAAHASEAAPGAAGAPGQAAAADAPAAEGAPEAEPPPRVNPPGRWVTTPDGERIFLLDSPRVPPAASPPPTAAPGPAAAPGPVAAPGPAAEPLPDLPGDGLQEIIATVPGVAVRWGAGVIAAAVGCLILLAAFVRYPEVVRGTATVTTPTPPVRVAAGDGGDIQELPAADNQRVRAGDVVAVLRSSARWRDVRWVRAHLERSGSAEEAAWRTLLLGEVQEPWVRWIEASAQYRAWETDPYVQERMTGLRSQLEHQRQLAAEAGRRAELLEREAALAERDAERSREMVARHLLSAAEAERAEANVLSRQQALASARGEVAAQGLGADEIEGRMLEMEQARRSEQTRLRLDVQTARAALAEAVRQWETRYLLVAPVAGRVSHFRTLSPGEYVAAGEPVLAVVPGGGVPSGTVLVADVGAARVRPGQRVLLAFEGFPVTEFGKVEARVEHVSLVPARPAAGGAGAPTHRVTVAFPRGLRTSTGQALALRQEMPASAEIVTGDLTVLQRLLAQLRGGPAAPASEER